MTKTHKEWLEHYPNEPLFFEADGKLRCHCCPRAGPIGLHKSTIKTHVGSASHVSNKNAAAQPKLFGYKDLQEELNCEVAAYMMGTNTPPARIHELHGLITWILKHKAMLSADMLITNSAPFIKKISEGQKEHIKVQMRQRFLVLEVDGSGNTQRHVSFLGAVGRTVDMKALVNLSLVKTTWSEIQASLTGRF